MKSQNRTFFIQTFGCQMNAGDSEWLARSLVARGFTPAPFEEASFYILNTCSVRDKAEQKVYSELGRIARYCKVHKRENVTVCVGGCVAQQVGGALAKRFPQVRLVFGTDGVARAPEAIDRLAEEPRLRLQILHFADEYEERLDPRLEMRLDTHLEPHLDSSPEISSPSTASPDGGAPENTKGIMDFRAKEPERATDADIPPAVFVNIMQGCDNFCAYCIVPYVRGRQKSRRESAILDECERLVSGGAREITLLGQNVNSYGLDGKQGGGAAVAAPVSGGYFADLLYRVAAIPGLERLRFVTPHPKDIAPEVIQAFGELDALCPRLHLPLQSGSDRILHSMNRRYDTARFMDIVTALRVARPGIVLTTDVIVGFPGETEEDFAATMRMMEACGFAHSFSFVYSDRPGAKAVSLPDKVSRPVALERLSRLQEWQNHATDKALGAMAGQDSVILLESKSRLESIIKETDSDPVEKTAKTGAQPVSWQGRTPEGFIVNVELDPLAAPQDRGSWMGAMLPVCIEAAGRHSLKGRQAGASW